MSQIAKKKFPRAMLLGGLNVNLNHLKKPVTILTMIHEANEVLTRKKDSHGHRLPKPLCIYEYTKNMSGVDISEQYMAYHAALRKSMKWSRKLFFHLFNMIILNSYLLNVKFGKRMGKQDFIEYIATYLVKTSIEHVSLPGRSTFSPDSNSRLVERHFPKNKLGMEKMVYFAKHVTSPQCNCQS